MFRTPKPKQTEADRTQAAQTASRAPKIPKKAAGAAVGVLAVGLVAKAFWPTTSTPPREPDEKLAQSIVATVQAPAIPPDPNPPAQPPQVIPAAARPMAPASPAMPPPGAIPQAERPNLGAMLGIQGKGKEEDKRPREVVYAAAAPARPRSDPPKEGGGGDPEERPTSTTVAFKGKALDGAKAGRALDQTFLMLPQPVSCILDTAIDSTLAGPIECHTDKEVTSPLGVTLMARHTLIMGVYDNKLIPGQGRILAMSGYAITPEGIPVPLGGPMADGLGRAGITGNIDTHTFQRFGGAVLLSLSQSALGLASSALQREGSTNLNIQTGDMNGLASEILRSTINIPPTITVPQGTSITLWVTAPTDFSDALRLRALPQEAR